MRIRSLRIENFRGIQRFDVEDLGDLVVIAGPNGCGKTCVLDAIRLAKSVYGGYVANEWQNWFGEFQVNIAQPDAVLNLFRNRDRSLSVSAEVELSELEAQFIFDNAEEILRPIIWEQVIGRRVTLSRMAVSAAEFSEHGPTVSTRVQSEAQQLRADVANRVRRLTLTISTEPQITIEPDLVMKTIFQTYLPDDIGVIDYHSSSRVYEREAVAQVNLDLGNATEQRRQQLLYNWRDKYRNVKTELATNYVTGIIARASGNSTVPDINDTLTELFRIFFPGKQYLGPVPQADGRLLFPVRLDSGAEHDIDELSSGEKELLYGYLRLRNSAPRNSVILLDEPELHLNPTLQQGLPDFYHIHLGRALGNQLWLVTHSDTILRQAVGNPNYSVFHISPAVSLSADSAEANNQVTTVTVGDELEQAVISIVGDLAAYKPRAKVVIVEGGGDIEFDVEMISRLFPAFAKSVNIVPGGSKRRVRDLYEILNETKDRAGLSERFFAIVDRDREVDNPTLEGKVHQWDRYHIENYILESEHVQSASAAILSGRTALAEDEVEPALKECARELLNRLVLERLQEEVNDQMIGAVSIGANPATLSPAIDILPSIAGSLRRMTELADGFSANFLAQREAEIRATLEAALENDDWRSEFPGRLVLKRFVDQHINGVSYEAFRYLVIDKMVDAGYQPPGMLTVIDTISVAT